CGRRRRWEGFVEELHRLVVVRLVRPDDPQIKKILGPPRLRLLALDQVLTDPQISARTVRELLLLGKGADNRLEMRQGFRVALLLQKVDPALELFQGLFMDHPGIRRGSGYDRPAGFSGC